MVLKQLLCEEVRTAKAPVRFWEATVIAIWSDGQFLGSAVLLSETQENIVCCTIGQDCSTTEHHNYECYALVHVHVFIYEQQL